MNTIPAAFSEQVQRCIDAAGKRSAMARRARKVMGVEGAVMSVTGLLRPGTWIRAGGCIRANLSDAILTTKRGVPMLALVLLFLTVGVGGSLVSHSSTAEVRTMPTGYTSPTTPLSPGLNADEWNEEMATVTSRARFKVH